MRLGKWMWVAALMCVASLGWAQGTDSVCEVNATTPKPGGAKAWEEGRKKHNQFHAAEKDKNSIMVYKATTGPWTGAYVTTVCGLTWKGMDGNDAMEQRDEADRQRTMADTSAANVQGYYVYRPELSLSKEGGQPAKRITVVHYFVKPGGIIQFMDSIKRVNAAIQKTNYPAKPSRWYVLANGGEGPRYVQVTDRNTWADMQGPDKTLAEMLKDAYGADDKTLQTLRDAIDHTVSEMLEYRADLSYLPAK